MKLIKPSVEYIEQPGGIEGVYQHIDRCARTCYKSEDKFDSDKSEAFVQGLVDKGHLAMLEHGTVYLKIPIDVYENCFKRRYFPD